MAEIDRKVLRQIPLFTLLDNDELEVLARQLDRRQILAGQMIFKEGDTGGTMYIVQSGHVHLFMVDPTGEKMVIGEIKPGDLFGEFSLLDSQPRSANAIAVENTELIVVQQKDVRRLVQAHPAAALDMMAMLTRRLRESNSRAMERNIRNVNEEVTELPQSFGDRLADMLTSAASNVNFTYLSAAWFFVWIIWNIGVIPGLVAFDPFPFGLLTMVVSLEAIFLSLFVLISQNRQAAHDKIRNDIEYEVNLRAEIEIRTLGTQLDDFQQLMLDHLSRLEAFESEKKKSSKSKTTGLKR
jgi:uncharacterized membrane protein